MSRIEKIVLIILVVFLFAGIGLSYYKKISQGKISIIPSHLKGHAERETAVISGRRIIDINTADIDGLSSLPGIGPALAQNIIDYRRKNGRFNSPDELLNIRGIGPKKYESLKERIRVDE